MSAKEKAEELVDKYMNIFTYRQTMCFNSS
jgi:hypothetical protein